MGKITRTLLLKWFPYIAFISAVVIIVGLIFFVSGKSTVEEWKDSETKENIGEIAQYFILKYDDGTTSEITNDLLKFLKIRHDDKVVDSVQYTLKVKPSKTHSPISINYSEYYLTFSFTENGISREKVVPFQYENPVELFYNESDSFQEVFWVEFSPFSIINYTFPDEKYEISLVPSGNLYYCVNNEWKNATLPKELPFIFDVKDERQIEITFSSG